LNNKWMVRALHVSASGRYQHPLSGACADVPCPNTAFHDNFESVSLWSFWWCDTSMQRRNGWVLVELFLLLPLFFLFSCQNINVSFVLFFYSIWSLFFWLFFVFFMSFDWFFSSILSLIIWFYFIFISNLVLIFLLPFFYHFFNWIFFLNLSINIWFIGIDLRGFFPFTFLSMRLSCPWQGVKLSWFRFFSFDLRHWVVW